MSFWYFGYGSNMDLISLRAKGVEPLSSERAALSGWRLRFNVRHFFDHEGGVANVEPTGTSTDIVRGVLHRCLDDHLALLDAAEAYGHGYDRIEVPVQTEADAYRAITYVGIPSFLDAQCRPTKRYLNIMVKGATTAGLDADYVDALRRVALLERQTMPPFVPPSGTDKIYTAATLAQLPLFTALAGAVFDMSGARWQHKFLHGLFGGKDMTLFHLKRLDNSDGSETLDDIKHDRLSAEQRRYLNEYLHAYSTEYIYVGRYIYD